MLFVIIVVHWLCRTTLIGNEASDIHWGLNLAHKLGTQQCADQHAYPVQHIAVMRSSQA